MARIAIIPGTIRSKLITAMELGRRLRAADHSVTIVAPTAAVVDDADLEYVRSDLSLNSAPTNKAGRSSRHSRIEQCQAHVEAADVAGFYHSLDGIAPDLVLIDIEAHAEIIATVQAGYRVALINVFFNLWKQPGTPPVHVPITPGVGLTGTRAGIELAWQRYRIWRWRELRRSRRNANDQLARLERFADRLGFVLAEHVDYYQGLLPFIYRRLPILNTNLLELDLPHEPNANSHYIGPMTSVDRRPFDVSREGLAVADEISRIADAASESGQKLVYCAFGAYFYGDDRDFWRRIIAAASMRSDWVFILGLGGRLEPGGLGSLPANVHAFKWAPQMVALRAADAALIHGGITTVYECLHFGVPMVTYPFAEIFDQYGTAARVRYHGVGAVGNRRQDTPARIVARIEHVLSDSRISERVATMRHHIGCYRSACKEVIAVADLTSKPGNDGLSETSNDGLAAMRR